MHAQIYEWFDIAFDKFGRTPTWQQTEIAQARSTRALDPRQPRSFCSHAWAPKSVAVCMCATHVRAARMGLCHKLPIRPCMWPFAVSHAGRTCA